MNKLCNLIHDPGLPALIELYLNLTLSALKVATAEIGSPSRQGTYAYQSTAFRPTMCYCPIFQSENRQDQPLPNYSIRDSQGPRWGWWR